MSSADEPVGTRDDGSGTFAVLPFGFSRYQHHRDLPEVPEEIDRITTVLAGLGGVSRPWLLAPAARDLSRVVDRLADWAAEQNPGNSVLLWLGHGQAVGNEAWLAVQDTRKPMRGTGLHPPTLAEHLVNQWRRRAQVPGAWTLVVVEACGADTFVRLLGATLLEQERTAVPERLAIVGVGGAGTNYLGEFGQALAATVNSFTDNDREVRLKDLVARLDDRISPGRVMTFGLHDATPLRIARVLPDAISAPLDIYAELRSFLQELPADLRSHFVAKAQGAEQGELAWYFVGRRAERAAIAGWLRQRTSGMLVVTGRAGAGKSALLGNVLVHTNPRLRDLFQRVGRFETRGEEQPPEDAFDAVVHLTGLTTADLVARIAEAARVEMPLTKPGAEVDWLLNQLSRQTFTLLVDALDEAQDPATVASSVLRRIAGLPRCRVVVGTRASTTEGPDHPDTTAEDLLDALGRSAKTETVVVGRDPDAIATYVRQRLTAALGTAGTDFADPLVDSVAKEIGDRDREFLYARLAVHEILARPHLLEPAHATELADLLGRDHRTLFGAAVTRLAEVAEINDPLLEALAMARGRGLPRADRIWAVTATALAGGALVGESDIDRLLESAAPYITLDAEDGQSVYRLAHRTFQEFFEARARETASGG
ncbi:hypothetical protein [Plantactinospora sp. B24E8]|uniref:nSTAND1 domain-containing NTPase n=1 Tax=Plantactinospora sp. B24E8 TaxID=3153567 RepID=UPI00325D7A4A